MDFEWSPAQRDLHDRTLAFARARLNSGVEERQEGHQFPADEWRMCGDFGILGLCVPEEYGGLGLDSLSTARAIEALGRGCRDAGLVFAASAHLFACTMPVLHNGSPELRARLLPGLASGTTIGANAITEAESGSDAFSLATTAERSGDDYLLNGVKSYVTNGPVADLFVVYARTDPDAGFLGISAFAVERGAPGLTVGKPFRKLGLTTALISSLYLDGCRVPAASRLGGEGRGAAVFTESMLWERSCLFAAYLGVMERQLEETIAYARERRQFRHSIGKYQAISHRIVDMKLRLEAARLLLYRACWLRDRGEPAALEIALSKIAVSEAAVQSSLDAIKIHGGMGIVSENGVDRALRDSIPATIFSGTSEVLRNIVASSLGLPSGVG